MGALGVMREMHPGGAWHGEMRLIRETREMAPPEEGASCAKQGRRADVRP